MSRSRVRFPSRAPNVVAPVLVRPGGWGLVRRSGRRRDRRYDSTYDSWLGAEHAVHLRHGVLLEGGQDVGVRVGRDRYLLASLTFIPAVLGDSPMPGQLGIWQCQRKWIAKG